ncbi:MAG: hypothetical protein ABDH28_06580, partial [Brevinematia bacterium]
EIEDFIGTAYYNYVLHLIEEKDFSKALWVINYVKDEKPRYYKPLIELTDHLIFAWGKSEIAKGNYESIPSIIEAGMSINKKSAYTAGINLLVELSKAFISKKEYRKIISYHKWFVGLFPEGKEGRQNLGYYYNLWGIELMNSNYLEESVKVFEEGIADLPENNVLKQNCSIAYAKLSQILYERKDFENSVTSINRAIELHSSKQLDTIRRNIYLAWVKHLAFSEEDFKKAKEVSQKALQIYPNDVELKRVYDYVSKK